MLANMADYSLEDNCSIHMNYSDTNVIWGRKPTLEVVWKSAIVIMIILVGMVGNSSVIFLVLKKTNIRLLPVNIYIVNLAIADFLNTFFTPITSLIGNIYQNYELGAFMCRFEILIKVMCILGSVFSVVAISFNRFSNITRVTKPVKSSQAWWTLVSISLIWIVAFLFGLPLAMCRHYHERPWADYLEKYCIDDPSPFDKRYWIFLMAILIYLPLSIMIIVYYLMITKVNRFISTLHNSQHNTQTDLESKSTKTDSISESMKMDDIDAIDAHGFARAMQLLSLQKAKFDRQMAREETMMANQHKRSILVNVMVYCIITVLCWLPLQVLVYYRAFKPQHDSNLPCWYEPTKLIAQLLCSVNSAINPFITFRKTFLQLYHQHLEDKRRRQHKRELILKHLRRHISIAGNDEQTHAQHKHAEKHGSSVVEKNWTSSSQSDNLGPPFCDSLLTTNRVLNPCGASLELAPLECCSHLVWPSPPCRTPPTGEPSHERTHSSTASLTKRVLMRYNPRLFAP